MARELQHGSALITLCLESTINQPAAFHFASSIAGVPNGPIPESLVPTPQDLNGAPGYGQSKYVVEQLCAKAVDSCPDLKATILRLGYLAGNRANGGNWSKTEEFPLVVRSLREIPFLPTRPNVQLSLLPVDDAARACVELMSNPGAGPGYLRVFNVANPRLTPWTVFRDAAEAAGLNSQPLGCHEWVTRLRTANPLYPLLDYFVRAYGDDDVSPVITTVLARQHSQHLENCAAVDVTLMESFVRGWAIVPAP